MSEKKPTANQTKFESAIKKLFGERWTFYRDGYYKVFKLNTMLIVTILIMTIIIAVLALKQAPEPKYFTTDNDGNISEIVPLSRALPDRTVTTFVEDAIQYCYSFNFQNNEEVIYNCQEYFTDKSWQIYSRSTRENLLPVVIESQLFMQTSKISAARIISKSEMNGRPIWTLEIDVSRTLTDRSKTIPKAMRYRVTVIRESENIRPKKLSIISITEKV